MTNARALADLLLLAWHNATIHNAAMFALQLGSVNSEFWILAWGSGGLVSAFHAMLLDDLGDMLAITYNVCLALLFSTMIFLSATGGAKTDLSFWREVLGFVFLYIALGAAYMNVSTKELDAYGRPGFLAGVLSYLAFAVIPSLPAHPTLLFLYGFLDWIAHHRLAWILTGFTAVEVTWKVLRMEVGQMFPFLWYLGIVRHPPIRVRRRTD